MALKFYEMKKCDENCLYFFNGKCIFFDKQIINCSLYVKFKKEEENDRETKNIKETNWWRWCN